MATVEDKLDPESPFLAEENGSEPSTKSEANNEVSEMGMLISDADDTKDGDGELVTFPESSHSFLFTEPIKSVPFFCSLLIAGLSYACLIIALVDNTKSISVPENVSSSVRAAQYMGKFLSYLFYLFLYHHINVLCLLTRRVFLRLHSYPHRSIDGGRNSNCYILTQNNI